MNLVTGEKVEILEVQYCQDIGYVYLVRSIIPGSLYEVNEQAYYPELIFSNLPLIIRRGKIGEQDYLVNVVYSPCSQFFSVMRSIDGVFRTGNKKGYFSNLLGDFACPNLALKVGISLVMEELQNERKF